MDQVVSESRTPTRQARRESRVGEVVSNNGNKTIRVEYRYSVRHPKYGKYMKRSTTLHVHDEENEALVGDIVEVMGCRRLSKMKTWRLVRILRSPVRETQRELAKD